MIDVLIPQEWIDKCEQFSLACAQTNINRYRSRGQTSIDKIVSDIYTGRLGEVGVYLHKISLGIPCSEPDFSIYEGKKKSYAADLTSGNDKIHVKTQSLNSATKYGTSWILQAKQGDSDKLFKFRTDNDKAVLCVIKSKNEVTILAEVSINWLFSNDLIEEPKVPFFIGTKKAIYWDKVKELIRLETNDKKCKSCEIVKILKEFGKDVSAKDKRRPACKACCKITTKAYRKKNPEKVKEGVIRWRNKNKNKEKNSKRKYRLRHTYGLSTLEYDLMLKDQKGVCLICKEIEYGGNQHESNKNLAVDHCHKTGKVRGLLCTNCNSALGKFKEDIEVMKRAIDYLTKHFSEDISRCEKVA